MLSKEQSAPKQTVLRDDVFKKTCNKLPGKVEARIIKDLTPLIVPSAELFAIPGAAHLDAVVGSVSEGRNNYIPVVKPRPQPAHSPGVNEASTQHWRYAVRRFHFTERRGFEKWTAYNLTKNITTSRCLRI